MTNQLSQEFQSRAESDNGPFDYAKLRDCIHCGLCATACPSYLVLGNEADSPRGRIYLMRAIADGRIEPDVESKRHFDLCLGCRACETACPGGVEYHPLLATTQKLMKNTVKPSLISRLVKKFLLDTIFMKPGHLKIAFSFMRFYQKSGIREIVRRFGLIALFSKKLETAEKFMPPIIIGHKPKNIAAHKSVEKRIRVGMFRGCVNDYITPDTNDASIRILQKCGLDVVQPENVRCCGAVHYHNDDEETAKTLARELIEGFEKSSAEIIAVNAAGCGAMMKEYGVLFKDDSEMAQKAEEFSTRVKDISEVVLKHSAELEFTECTEKAVYDEPCHLQHAQHVSSEPRALLSKIPGLEIVAHEESNVCCGSGGTFNIVEPEVSSMIIKRKMENIMRTGAEIIITGNIGCMIQLFYGKDNSNFKCKIMHFVELLDEYTNG